MHRIDHLLPTPSVAHPPSSDLSHRFAFHTHTIFASTAAMGMGSIGVRGLLVVTMVLLLAASTSVVAEQQAGQQGQAAAPPQTVGDTWPEFEVPPIPEDKDGTQIRLSRIRDGCVHVCLCGHD